MKQTVISHKYLIYAILAFSMSSDWLNAQNLIINTTNRENTSLNGKWHYIIDPYETGYYDYRYSPYDETSQKSKNRAAFFNNANANSDTDRIEYSFDKSATLNVPGDWNSQDSMLLYYEGSIWYKKSFDYTKTKENNRIFIWFGAINYRADVYLNGVKLGYHIGGFTPFSFEVTNIIKNKGNYIIVKVDNKRHKDGVPTLNTDWWNYGGITRDVKIIEEAPTFIEDYFIHLSLTDANTIEGYIKLNGDIENQQVSIEIEELKVKEQYQVGKEGVLNFSFKAKNIKYWSPNNPKLYKVAMILNGKALFDTIGFRTISTRGADLLLNGKPIFLRGISIHEENPLKMGRAVSEEDARLLLNWAKELHCNFVRLAHYPHNEHIIRLADKMGIMVWEEIPVYWTINWSSEPTYQNAENQLTAVIGRDKNRAATIIWSMANETPVSENRTEFIRKLISHTKQLDPTRLISVALEKHTKEGTPFTQIITDPLANDVDVLGINQYIGWYDGLPTKCEKVTWQIAYDKPLIITEFGGGALAGMHGSKNKIWTEEYQAYLYEQNLLMIDKIDQLRGVTPWILVDFRSPKRVLPGIQDGWNRKGLISNNGIKKKAFNVLKEFYKLK